MRSTRLLYGLIMTSMVALMPLSAQAAATLSSTYTATASGADVTITNNSADALYNISLKPMGAGVDASATPISISQIAAGGTTTFSISSKPLGYIVFSGSATDVAGQTVNISFVSEGK